MAGLTKGFMGCYLCKSDVKMCQREQISEHFDRPLGNALFASSWAVLTSDASQKLKKPPIRRGTPSAS